MTEPEIYDKLKELEKIIDPSECNVISSYISAYITDYEEALHEQNLIVSNKWLKIREESKSNTEADRKLEVTDEYRTRERIKLSMSQLKRMRSDLRNRFDVLTYKRY